MDNETIDYLKRFRVLVGEGEASVYSISGADRLTIDLTLVEYGLLAAANPAGLIGNNLLLDFPTDEAVALAQRILAVAGK